ncbi:response regulator transcription factor [Rubellicoccus peritrichatus]|uniref:Response regulator transcription factor n=1 Tax=Rubellicoccus peritrichatus TaxID=3080537 RepID=A0AAQ3L788_9BACT|nr:response regulator transcription factor [Puniceicoccus sp. CR14]WOO40889.1 response regulator transcription factor [Puniceicoccus sp. CR14]
MNRIKVLLVDDHPVYRDGLWMMLSSHENIKVIGEASNGKEAIDKIKEEEPDIVLLDLDMPELDGASVARIAKEENLSSKIIFLTMHKDAELLRKSIELGVKGYLLKDSRAQEIIDAIGKVANGENYLSPPIANLLLNQVKQQSSHDTETLGIQSLTVAERKVLRLIATDRISKEIASDLGLSIRTVESHRARICKKLGLSGVHSLVKFAFENREKL